MARERRYADKGASPAAGMHLFDFNETLSGKRLPDDRRIALDYQLYKGRDSPNLRSKRDEIEIIRSSSRTPDKKSFVGDEYLIKSHSGRDMDFRSPNVVARLMGLETLPKDPVPAKQQQIKKKWGDRDQTATTTTTPRHGAEKQPRRQSESKPPTPAATVVLPVHESYYPDRVSRNRVADRGSSDVAQMEDLKRQLAMKQMLVREKLNEAKLLLTGEKLSDKRWIVANKQLNQSKEFLDAIDFFQSNRNAFLKYVDDQDSVLGNHIEKHQGNHRDSRQNNFARPIPDGLRNPIVRKVIEGRREDALKNFSRQPSFAGSGDDTVKNAVPDNLTPTRIVVLKPSPNRNSSPSPSSATFSPGAYANEPIALRRVTEVTDASRNETAANPREIAKEIARQVRESVVRDLARNATGSLHEQGAGKRLNMPVDTSDGPRLGGGDFARVDAAATTPTARSGRRPKQQAEVVDDPGVKSLLQRKPVRPRQQVSGSSPPPARPVSKGIVVLVPDQSVSSRVAKASEPSLSKPVAKASEPSLSKPVARKDRDRDRVRRSHQALTETSHKLGDTIRKPRHQQAEVSRRINNTNVESTNRDTSIQEDTDATIRDTAAVPVDDDLLGYGASFLKASGFEFESQGENEASCEASDSRDTVESGYTADICVSEAVSQPDTDALRSPSGFVSSIDSVPAASTSQCDEEIDSANQAAAEAAAAIEISAEVSSWRQVEVSQEEELVKDSPTTTDVVDVVDADETSVSSDNSGQPSPISVLESSFEKSPGHVDFDTISSELEELRAHLNRLKWDHADQERLDGAIDAPDSIVDKVIVAEQLPEPESEIQTEITLEETTPSTAPLQWPELDKCSAKETEEKQMIYVKNILLASGLIKSSDSGNKFVVEQHSPLHSLDSMLFDQLEGFYRTEQTTEAATRVSRMRRRLLFDMVDEILVQKRVSDPWLATVRTVPGGGLLLSEVWSALGKYFAYPQGEDLQHTVENLIEKYLTSDRWMDLRSFVEAIGMDLEGELLNELIEECIDL